MHNFSDYIKASDQLNAVLRSRKEEQVEEKYQASIGSADPTRISLVKSEDKVYKAGEKTHILESLLYKTLDNTVGPCHHLDVVEEDEREKWRSLPLDDWRRTTVFKGLRLHANGGDKEAILDLLINSFDQDAAVMQALTQIALDNYWRDIVDKAYVPMNKVIV